MALLPFSSPAPSTCKKWTRGFEPNPPAHSLQLPGDLHQVSRSIPETPLSIQRGPSSTESPTSCHRAKSQEVTSSLREVLGSLPLLSAHLATSPSHPGSEDEHAWQRKEMNGQNIFLKSFLLGQMVQGVAG